MSMAGEASLLRGIADAMPAMIGYWNRDLRNEFANAAYLEYFGWTPEELIGVHIREVLGPELFAMNAPYMERALAGQTQTFDRTLVDAAGRNRHTQASYIPHVVDGEVIGFFVLVSDTTEKVESARSLAESETKFRLLAENATDVVWELDSDSVMRWVSPSLEAVLGWRPEQLIGTRPRTLTHPADQADMEAKRSRLFSGSQLPQFELRMRCADQTYKWMSVQVRPIVDSAGTVDGVIVGLRDVHEEVMARQALAQSERLFRLVMDGSPQPMAVVGMRDLRWMRINPRLGDLLGRDAEWLLSHTVNDVLHPDDIEPFTAVREYLRSGVADRMQDERRFLRPDGGVVWTAHSVNLLRDSDGSPLFYVSHLQDITQERARREDLNKQASHDELTGLANRRQFNARLADALAAPQPQPGLIGVFFCDVDGLKNINDTHGHQAGDQVIKHVAARIASVIRAPDIAARIGGDEFIVMAQGMPGPDTAQAIADRIHRAVNTRLRLSDASSSEITPSVSIGVALARPGDDAATLLGRADAALYSAKNLGRNQTPES